MDPVLEATLDLARRHTPAGAAPVAVASLDALPEDAPALACAFPTRLGPLIPTLQRLRDALAPGGVLAVADLVWQTAPSPELARAFAPAPGRERVRPIEGYEMQAEHAGLDLVAREDLPRERWAPLLANDAVKREALAADARGAAKVAAWALRRAE